MRRLPISLPAIAATALLAAVAVAPAAGAATHAPAPWATVNVCDPASGPGSVGVRVSMPAGPGSQWFRVRMQYQRADGSWRLAEKGGDGGWTRLGAGRTGARGGTTFAFPVPVAGSRIVLRGLVSVQWRRGDRIRRARTLTTATGHAAQSGGTSQAQCVIAR